jgi:integrase
VPTRETPIQASTLRVTRAALRDFYLVLKDAGLYPFANPLTSEILVTIKREHTHALANRGAPDHAGIREETREQSRRRPTAFLHHQDAQGWKPNLRKELADVREGMHKVLDALIDSEHLPLREKVVLELLRNTGARVHEVVLLTVGGYRNEGIAGQARVVDKGSYGREIKTIYFAHNPRVEQLLTAYLEQVRPLHDPHGRTKLADLGGQESLFLTDRKTPYSLKSFYWHWYQHYTPLQSLCPVRISPHDIRHLFVTEFLITLRLACGAGTDQFDSEQYRSSREAFASLVMGWRSPQTIDIYDQSRDGERTLSVLAAYQQSLSQRQYLSVPLLVAKQRSEQEASAPGCPEPRVPEKQEHPIWWHDAETLAWVKKMQQQARETGERG